MNVDLIDLADRFARANFVGRREVLGVLLRGSSAVGVRDKFVDLDFDLVVADRYLRAAKPLGDVTRFEGVEVCWDYKSIEGIESELRDWMRDTDLWAYSTGKIVYDPSGRVKALLDIYRQYPEPVRQEKMFSYFFYATGASPYNSGKAILREDYASAQMFLVNAVELYTCLLYLLNHRFIPYRKWLIAQLDKLPNRPADYVKRVSGVLFGAGSPNQENMNAKQAIVMGIMDEIKMMLLQEGLDPHKIGDDIWRFEPKYFPSI